MLRAQYLSIGTKTITTVKTVFVQSKTGNGQETKSTAQLLIDNEKKM